MKRLLLSLVCLIAVSTAVMAAAPKLEVRLVVDCRPGMPSFVLPRISALPEHICLSTDLVMDQNNILRVTPSVDAATGMHQALITYDKDAQARMAATTRANIGHRIAIVFNDSVVMAPIVNGAILDDSVKVVGSAEDIAALLAAFRNGPSPT